MLSDYSTNFENFATDIFENLIFSKLTKLSYNVLMASLDAPLVGNESKTSPLTPNVVRN